MTYFLCLTLVCMAGWAAFNGNGFVEAWDLFGVYIIMNFNKIMGED